MAAQDNIVIAQKLFEMLNHHDFDGATSLLADNVVWFDVPSGNIYKGLDGFKQYWGNIFTTFHDYKADVTNVFAADDYVAVEYICKGTNTGPFIGPLGQMPPTGHRIELHACEVCHVKDGKIADGRSYYDLATVMRELGHLPKVRQAGA